MSLKSGAGDQPATARIKDGEEDSPTRTIAPAETNAVASQKDDFNSYPNSEKVSQLEHLPRMHNEEKKPLGKTKQKSIDLKMHKIESRQLPVSQQTEEDELYPQQ